METTLGTPFVLKFAEHVVPSVTSGHYDRETQLWVTPEGQADRNTLATSAPERTDEIDQGPNV